MSDILDLLARIDVRLMVFCNVTLKNPIFDAVMPVFDYGNVWRVPLFLFWLGIMIFGGRRARLLGIGGAVLLLLTDPISSRLIKPLVARIRPCNVLSGINMWKDGHWIKIPDPVLEVYRASYSMPSSHAANTGGQALWWGWAYPRTRGIWWGLGLTIGFSRVYDGLHWPGDVMAGWLVGGLAFGLIWMVAVRVAPGVLSSKVKKGLSS